MEEERLSRSPSFSLGALACRINIPAESGPPQLQHKARAGRVVVNELRANEEAASILFCVMRSDVILASRPDVDATIAAEQTTVAQ